MWLGIFESRIAGRSGESLSPDEMPHNRWIEEMESKTGGNKVWYGGNRGRPCCVPHKGQRTQHGHWVQSCSVISDQGHFSGEAELEVRFERVEERLMEVICR